MCVDVDYDAPSMSSLSGDRADLEDRIPRAYLEHALAGKVFSKFTSAAGSLRSGSRQMGIGYWIAKYTKGHEKHEKVMLT